MSKLTNNCRSGPITPLPLTYNATANSTSRFSGAAFPDLSPSPEQSFDPLTERQTAPVPNNRIPIHNAFSRSASAGAGTGRRHPWETCSPAPAGGQVRQMRDGTSLGLEGLARYNTSLNVLLIFVPLGIGASFLGHDDTIVFSACFIGMIPLAMHLSRATEDIAEKTNDAFGALVNVTFGNAVEIILSISALRAGRLSLIQDTLAGSILSNLLLVPGILTSSRDFLLWRVVLGSAFLWGGIRFSEQEVSPAVCESNADMLAFSVFGLSIPAILAATRADGPEKVSIEERLSLVTSICLLILYCLYMFFQLYTHDHLYDDLENPETSQLLQLPNSSPVSEVEDEEERTPNLTVSFSVLVVTVVTVSVLSELLVGSIDGFSRRAGLGEKFIAIVLLPVIGNAVEHMSAILVAGHNKIDLSIGIACGSSVQIALFAAPTLVVVSWILGSARLTLNFHTFETVCIAFSVFVVNVTLRDSKSNWLEGAVLVMCYIIVAAAFYFTG